MDQDRRGAASAMRAAVLALLNAAIPPERSGRRKAAIKAIGRTK
jgi:hypothetical protein